MCHCPASNFFFAKEALPVRQLLKRGMKVGLGTVSRRRFGRGT